MIRTRPLNDNIYYPAMCFMSAESLLNCMWRDFHTPFQGDDLVPQITASKYTRGS